jgi:DNA-binding IclR family transcriptional regulator
MADTKIPSRYRVQVLDRSFRILNTLAGADTELSPVELANRLHLHKSTVHRLLSVLEWQRLIQRTPQGTYGLGLRLIEMGSRATRQHDLAEDALPFLQRLVETTGETAHIGVLNGTEMVSIANVRGRWALSTPSTVGRRTHVHCTSVGKAFLAFLSADASHELIGRLKLTRQTRQTIVTGTALRTELARIRRRGYAIDDEEVEVGLRCIGAPVRNYKGDVIAAIGIAGPVFRIQKSRVPELARAVIRAAAELSAHLGYERREDNPKKIRVS